MARSTGSEPADEPADEDVPGLGGSPLRDGPVTVFHHEALLDDAVSRLRQAGYHLVELDCRRWVTDADMHADLAESLDFPAYYGRNLDALNDCLLDVVSGDYGWPTGATGVVLVLRSFDTVVARDAEVAAALLRCVADQSPYGLLPGNPLTCLVQTDGWRPDLPPSGARRPTWTRAGWPLPEPEPGAG